jgi:hypothetical protein
MTIKELYDWAKKNDCIDADLHFMDVHFLMFSKPVNIKKNSSDFVTIVIEEDDDGVVGEYSLPLQ